MYSIAVSDNETGGGRVLTGIILVSKCHYMSELWNVQVHKEATWGEWAIAMHGRYESHILFISKNVYYIDTIILLYFSTIYCILDILYMKIVVCLFNTAICDS